MPIRKFRSIEEMSAAAAAPSRRSPWQRLEEDLAVGTHLYRRDLPPGVHKNRSIEEANARRAAWSARPPAPR